MIKKSSSTVAGIVMSVIICMGLFTMMFIYMKSQTDHAGVAIPDKYNDTFNRITQSQNELNTTITEIQDNVNDVKEADTAYQVALNGFKGLGNTLKLTVNFVGVAVNTLSAIVIPLDFVPNEIKVLATIGLVIFIVLVVLAALKGDPKLVN